MRDTDISYSQ